MRLQPCRLEVRVSDWVAAPYPRDRLAARWGDIAIRGSQRVEQYACRSGRIVGNHRVVSKVDLHRILDRDPPSGPAGNVIHDDVVGDGDSEPVRGSAGVVEHVVSVDVLQ